jgi:hypothetical protein
VEIVGRSSAGCDDIKEISFVKNVKRLTITPAIILFIDIESRDSIKKRIRL